MPFEITPTALHTRVRVHGVFTSRDLAELIDIARQGGGTGTPPLRYLVLLSEVTDFNLQFSTLFPLSEARNRADVPPGSRTAIVATRPLERGIAHMWAALLHQPCLDLQVFESPDAAEAWLDSQPAPGLPGIPPPP